MNTFSTSRFGLTRLFTVAVITLALTPISTASAVTQEKDYFSTEKSASVKSEKDNTVQGKLLQYPYGYQFYRHGRGHRHGPSRGYYHSTILSLQN